MVKAQRKQTQLTKYSSPLQPFTAACIISDNWGQPEGLGPSENCPAISPATTKHTIVGPKYFKGGGDQTSVWGGRAKIYIKYKITIQKTSRRQDCCQGVYAPLVADLPPFRPTSRERTAPSCCGGGEEGDRMLISFLALLFHLYLWSSPWRVARLLGFHGP